MSNQLGNHLRIRLPFKLVPQPLQLLPQLLLIKNGTIVNNGYLPIGIGVRMGVFVGDASVSCPASVGYADGVAEDWVGGVSDELDGIDGVVGA